MKESIDHQAVQLLGRNCQFYTRPKHASTLPVQKAGKGVPEYHGLRDDQQLQPTAVQEGTKQTKTIAAEHQTLSV